MIQKLLTAFFFIAGISANAQNFSAKVVDSDTGESIPFANIKIGEQTLISNDEGNFTLAESTGDAVLVVSYMGYRSRQITVDQLKSQQSTIKMVPNTYELSDVNVSNVKPDPYTIMLQVKKNLQKHYGVNQNSSKDMIFRRQTSQFRPKILDVEIKKSTGFSKKSLASVNSQFNAFTSKLIANPSKTYTDMLCNYYTASKPAAKPVATHKLEVIKATRLNDESRSSSLDDMQDSAIKILLQHVDSSKYYRIKSGLIGSRDTISLRRDFQKKKQKKKSQLTQAKLSLERYMTENNFMHSENMDFVNNPELYEYVYDGTLYTDKNEFLYVLKFKPKKSKANYVGKLYVSETDFAVVRADYNLAKGKKLGGFNMKLILGIKASENVSNGTLIFKPNSDGNGYYLHYASTTSGQYFYVHRPLKFIELADEERDVVAFDLKVEGNSIDKTEYLNISRTEIADASFDKINEEDFVHTRLKRYDPNIWKGYSAIEPLEEMKQFEAVE